MLLGISDLLSVYIPRSGPARSTSHTAHATQNMQVGAAERPAGKPSSIGLHWGIQ